MNRQNFPNPPSIQYVRSNDVQFHFFSKLSLDHLSIPFPYISGIVFKILKHLIKVVYIPQLCFQEILILEVVGGVWETFLNKALKWFWKLDNCLRAVVLKPDYLGCLKKKSWSLDLASNQYIWKLWYQGPGICIFKSPRVAFMCIQDWESLLSNNTQVTIKTASEKSIPWDNKFYL